MNTPTPADTVPVRLAAERLRRLDALGAWGRLPFDRATDRWAYDNLRRAVGRREVMLNIIAARQPSHA